MTVKEFKKKVRSADIVYSWNRRIDTYYRVSKSAVIKSITKDNVVGIEDYITEGVGMQGKSELYID